MSFASAVHRTVLVLFAALLAMDEDTIAQSNRELKGHIGGIEGIAFSADSTLLVSVGFDGGLKIWDVAQGAEIALLKESRMDTTCAQFSPDGKLLATGHREPVVILWDLQSGSRLKSLPLSGPREFLEEGEGHTDPVNSVAFSDDGRLLATGSDDTEVKIWDVATGRELATLKGHRSNVSKVSFHPQAPLLASASMDGTLILWSLKSWKPLHRISVAVAKRGPLDVDFEFSSDGKSIAASADNEIELYRTDTGTHLGSLGQGSRVAFHRNKDQIAHDSGERNVQLVEVPGGTVIHTLTGHRGRVTCLAFSPDGKSLAVGNVTSGTIKLWNLQSLAENRASSDDATTDQHARLVDQRATQTDLVEVQRPTSGQPVQDENRPILHFDVSNSPTLGQQILTVARKPDGSSVKTLKQTHSPVWHPHGQQFAYFRESQQGGRDSLWVASLEGKKRELFTAEVDQFLRWHPAWSPDGDTLAVLSVQVTQETADQTGEVRFEVLVIDLASGKVKQRCPFPANVIRADPLSPPSVFKWSPAGRYVLISWESSVVVDLKRNRSIRITEDYSVAEWAPNGESVLFFRFLDQDTAQGRLMGLYRRSLNENSSRLIADSETLSRLNLLEIPGMFRLKLLLSATRRYLVIVSGAVREYAKVTDIRVYRWDEHDEFDLDSPMHRWSFESEIPIHLQWSPHDTQLAVIMMKNWSKLTVETFRLSDGTRSKLSDIQYDPREDGVGGLDFIGTGKLLSWSD